MIKTVLTRRNGKKVENSGTAGITMTHNSWGDETGHIQIEWDVESKEEMLTMATEFLRWLDHATKNTGIVENSIVNFCKKTGRFEYGFPRFKYKQADHPNAKPKLNNND